MELASLEVKSVFKKGKDPLLELTPWKSSVYLLICFKKDQDHLFELASWMTLSSVYPFLCLPERSRLTSIPHLHISSKHLGERSRSISGIIVLVLS